MRLPIDVPVVVLSHLSSSILSKNDGGRFLQVKVDAAETRGTGSNNSSEEICDKEPNVVDVNSFRNYWAILRLSDISMDPSTAVIAEEDYVRARQENAAVSSDDFHSWLILARLLALSYGHSSVSENTWKRMRELEGLRLQSFK